MDLPDALSRLRRRAWPAPPDLPWREAEFAVIDLETTGLDLRRDHVVSIGIVVVRAGRITADRYYQVVKPPVAIGEEAMKIHALTPGELESAPALAEVLPQVRDRLRGRVLVAHAVWVERAFVDRALRPLGERLPDEVVDTAGLARRLGLATTEGFEPNLETLARTLGLPVHTPHHALGDALTTAQVLLVAATRLEQGHGDERPTPLRVRDLVRSGRG